MVVRLQKKLSNLGQIIYRLPSSIDAVVTQAKRGNLTLKSSFAPESRSLFLRLEKSINRLSWTIVSAGLLIAGVNLKNGNSWSWISILVVMLSFIFFFWAVWGNRNRLIY